MIAIAIGLLVFPRMTQLDMTGPYEVFRSIPGATVLLVGRSLDPVTVEGGMRIMPDRTLADCPPLDVVCVPGGAGVDALMEDAAVLGFLRTQAASARYVTSVCTGALVLGAAGLLHGRRATTHWASRPLLERFGAIPTSGRVVRDGNLLTGGGVTAGIDFALTLAAELAGEAVARGIQLGLEYAPAPPFAGGTPDSSPPDVVARACAAFAARQAERAAIIARVTAS